METDAELIPLADLESPFVVCDPSGDKATPSAVTVAIGPEGGWSEGRCRMTRHGGVWGHRATG